ncbi:arabinan endo-1,5-alpha-L-arabinosidase [Cryobacterium sp. TMB1-7]|uniref:arabinan endo-1,5-alpha-L-arabinosidase n=1 Tax=Cryobacterium sp. TMB1-7 TaxID=2555866 RepID=UPI00106B464B|nr:arabinan endo-1,5-alpha-L-arabinosidase [Cryobacterium sp. TMB1-7]TFC61718.1 arabinan endo-1,5-alpha-L-arabinosidase [Cryobacterium sp. TMB1-7]
MVGDRARLGRAGQAGTPAGLFVLTLAAVVLFVLSGCSAEQGARELSGDIATHDPAYVAGVEGDASYVYSTGNGQVADGNIQIRRSMDGLDWEYIGEVWQEKPDWLVEAVPGVDNLWAPELYQHDGTWYLYYSASLFGTNTSVIALATNSTLDPDAADYAWVDRGEVITSVGTDYNAIDAGVVEDAEGTPWLSFGSFSSGLHLVELDWPSGLRADDADPVLIADRNLAVNALEAPFLLAHDGFYYLFFSRDFCCRGVDSSYNIAVGRSETVDGPYLDANGAALLDDGGTPVLSGDGDRVGPGGQSVSGGTLAFHYYDASLDGAFQLGLIPLGWDDGWPVVAWE